MPGFNVINTYVTIILIIIYFTSLSLIKTFYIGNYLNEYFLFKMYSTQARINQMGFKNFHIKQNVLAFLQKMYLRMFITLTPGRISTSTSAHQRPLWSCLLPPLVPFSQNLSSTFRPR